MWDIYVELSSVPGGCIRYHCVQHDGILIAKFKSWLDAVEYVDLKKLQMANDLLYRDITIVWDDDWNRSYSE